jgi:uncharacterized protein (TIGR02270 family)
MLSDHIDFYSEVNNTYIALVAKTSLEASCSFLSFERSLERMHVMVDGLCVHHAQKRPLTWDSDIASDWSQLFAHTLLALRQQDADLMQQIFVITEAEQTAIKPVVAAFAYVNPAQLQEFVKNLLASDKQTLCEIGLRICAEHRIGKASLIATMLNKALQEEQFNVASWALRVAGKVGSFNGLHLYQDLLSHSHIAVSEASAYAAVLLGDRENGKSMLTKAALKRGSLQDEAILLSLRVNDSVVCQHLMKDLASQAKAESATPHEKRILLIAAGYSGDVGMVNWLFTAMEHRATARLAGVAFSMITGADLALLDLDQPPPADFEEGPNDDPDDDSIEMDADSGAAWPDVAKVKAWYAQSGLAEMKGQRLLCGQPQSIKAALDTLRNGFQNQRRVAAYDLALLDPGKPLFHWYEDPAQQKIKMDALDARFGIKRENPYPYVSVFARM